MTKLLHYPPKKSNTSYVIPDTVTEIQGIAFRHCSNLAEIVIPKSVSEIGAGCFTEGKEGFCLYVLRDSYAEQYAKENGIAFQYQISESGQCGENLQWTLDYKGVLTISGSGDMFNYSSDNLSPWLGIESKIKGIVIGKEVASIGDNAFFSSFPIGLYANVEYIDFSNAESLLSIGKLAFSGWKNKAIELPNGLLRIGDEAFCGSGLLIKLPESLEYIGDNCFLKDSLPIHSNTVLWVVRNSYAHKYADQNNYVYVFDNELLKISYPEDKDGNITTPPVVDTQDKNLYDITLDVHLSVPTITTGLNVFYIIEPDENGEVVDKGNIEDIRTISAEKPDRINFKIRIKDISKYSEGGVFPYQVKVMVPLLDGNYFQIGSQSLSIYFESDSGKGLNFDTDVWHFHNTGETPTPLNEADKRRLLSGLDPTTKAGVLYHISSPSGTEDGSCFGMSTVVVLNKMNVFEKMLNLGERKYEENKSWITYYHLLQYLPAYISAEKKFCEKSINERLEYLEDKVEQSCMLLCIQSSSAGHAVVAYAVEEGDYFVNGKHYDTKVLTYDPNAYDNEEAKFYCYTALYFKEETGNWQYWSEAKLEGGSYLNYSNYNSEEGKIVFVGNDPYILDSKNYNGIYTFEPELLINNSAKVRIQNGSLLCEVDQGKISGNEDLISYFDAAGTGGDLHIVIPHPQEEVIITNLSGAAETVSIGRIENDVYYRVDASKAQGLRFSANKGVELVGNEKDYTITVAYDNYASDVLPSYTVTGSVAGDVKVSVVDNGIELDGGNIGNASITGTDFEGVTKTITLPGGTQKVSVDGSRKDLNLDDGTHVKRISLDKTEVVLKVGESVSLRAEVTPESAENKMVAWTSSDNGVVAVADGVLTALREGTAQITVSSVENPSIQANCTVTVKGQETESEPVTEETTVEPGTEETTAESNTEESTSEDAEEESSSAESDSTEIETTEEMTREEETTEPVQSEETSPEETTPHTTETTVQGTTETPTTASGEKQTLENESTEGNPVSNVILGIEDDAFRIGILMIGAGFAILLASMWLFMRYRKMNK